MPSLDLSRMRGDIEPFHGELMEEFYQNFAGLKEDMSTVAIYDKYAHLFSQGAIETVTAAQGEEPGPEDSRWLKYLRTFSTMGFMDSAVRTLTDKATTFESRSTVEVGGERIPYRMVPVMLRNEHDAAKRRKLFDSKLAETEKLNEILLERMAKVHDLSTELGFKSYHDLCSTLKGINYRALEEQMEEFLRRTEKLYTEQMDKVLTERANKPITESWSYDIPYAFRGEEFDRYFDKDKLIDSFFATLRQMGIDPERYSNVKVDIETRPKKSPRAFCAPIRVPEDIRLVIQPTGGWRDYYTFFHEAGHAWHFGSTKRTDPAEYRYLGDNSVTEAFAFMFEHVTAHKLWLEKTMGMKEADAYVRFFFLDKLMFLRRYAAKLIYELKLHNAGVSSEFQGVYRSCLQRALKFKHAERNYLEDVDDGFYCAEYLRAWILDAQLRAALEEQFGEDWLMSEKSGGYLRELWSYGQKYNADEVVKTIGYVDLDIEPLVLEIERSLGE